MCGVRVHITGRYNFIWYLTKIDELDESEEAGRTVAESADYHALINIVEILKQKLIGKYLVYLFLSKLT